MTAASLALAAHVVGTCFMCGLSWMVQVVHYPLFPFAAGPRWSEFHAAHSRRVSWVVGVPWALQGAGGLVLLVSTPAPLAIGWVWAGLALAGATVVATLAFAIPAHGRLSSGFSVAVHRRLVVTNWVRTAAWTAGSLVGFAMVVLSLLQQ